MEKKVIKGISFGRFCSFTGDWLLSFWLLIWSKQVWNVAQGACDVNDYWEKVRKRIEKENKHGSI